MASILKEKGFSVIISGDPCYGACDLSIDLLEYADVIVHLGHTPLISHPDVIHVPWREDFDIDVIRLALPLLSGKRIGVVTTAQHTHMLDLVVRELGRLGYEAVVSPGSGRTPEHGQVLGCSFSAARISGITDLLFIGTGRFHPLGIALATGSRVISLDPFSREVSVISSDRFLRKRHALVEKARDADPFGIIVSRKPGQARFGRARELAGMGRNAFLIFMDEVSPDGLLDLGFPAYVNTACPRLSYDDQIRFPVPVITPEEFEIICGLRPWDNYRMDEFDRVCD